MYGLRDLQHAHRGQPCRVSRSAACGLDYEKVLEALKWTHIVYLLWLVGRADEQSAWTADALRNVEKSTRIRTSCDDDDDIKTRMQTDRAAAFAIPVRHSGDTLGLTLTLTLTLILTPGMADLRNGGPPEWGAGTALIRHSRHKTFQPVPRLTL